MYIFKKMYATRRSSNSPSPLWLWWRRQAFYLGRLRITTVIFLFICLIIFLYLPNPFSSIYTKISITQNVEWNNVYELVEMKAKVNKKGFNCCFFFFYKLNSLFIIII